MMVSAASYCNNVYLVNSAHDRMVSIAHTHDPKVWGSIPTTSQVQSVK